LFSLSSPHIASLSASSWQRPLQRLRFTPRRAYPGIIRTAVEWHLVITGLSGL
jgi:hypothetical protein